jgi:ABC-type uncharacterized transport system involved in gliding motility auxiliary subunit
MGINGNHEKAGRHFFTRNARFVLFIVFGHCMVFFFVNFLASFLLRGAVIDATENNLYTLSDGTKKVLQSMDDTLTIRMFYSEYETQGMPDITNFAMYVKNLLKQYSALSDGKIVLDFVNPEEFSDIEDLANEVGIIPVSLDELGGYFYFGMTVGINADTYGTIPVLSPERIALIEYDITSIIEKLESPEKSIVGIVSGVALDQYWNGFTDGVTHSQMDSFFYNDSSFDPDDDRGRASEALKAEYSDSRITGGKFDVRLIDQDAPEDFSALDALVIIHPIDLSDDFIYAIDQFALSGGQVLLFVDPFLESRAEGVSMSSDIPYLLENWGVVYNHKKTLLDGSHEMHIPTYQEFSQQSSGYSGRIFYPGWMQIFQDYFNSEDTATSSLKSMVFVYPGEIAFDEFEGTQFTPLIWSSEQSTFADSAVQEQDGTPFLDSEDENSRGIQGKMDINKPVIAARISGRVMSTFPEYDGHAGHVQEGNINVVLVADVDFLSQDYLLGVKEDDSGGLISQTLGDNAFFVQNLLDQFSQSSALISLRSRHVEARSLKIFEDIRKKADFEYHHEERRLSKELDSYESDFESWELKGDGMTMDGMAMPKGEVATEFLHNKIQKTRKKLRKIHYDMRQKILALKRKFEIIHIVGQPLIIICLGFFISRRMRTCRV